MRSSILYFLSSTPQPPAIWTPSQRRVLIALLVVFLVGLSIEIWRRPAGITDPPGWSARDSEIADRIDPNIADAAALAAIPNLGEKRAQQIVDYRNTFAIQHPGEQAFTQPDDLMRIKGIGIGTVTNMSPFLTFLPVPRANPHAK